MRFANIYNETEENLRLALLSLWAPGHHPMRKAIEDLFDREPLITEPVYQSAFGWEQVTNDEWKHYLNEDVIEKVGIGKKYTPFIHQAESWKQLKEGKSIVVTSGTGSGKTECFMYPVISDLYERGCENAVQAIFLYPLNALMEDQKSRLAKFCDATNLRFAVYNGDTPEYKADGRDDEDYASEVKTRNDIRDEKENGTRPQILLTNPSMLEYVLVREKDQVLLNKSAGKLRWIVIDEAHSYSGSSAVELAYQIKRVLDAFKVSPNEVRFACTSATIGGEEGVESLKNFISTIIGQPIAKIEVIGGNRIVPEINEDEITPVLSSNHISTSAKSVLTLRTKINEVAGMTLKQIWEWLCPNEDYDIQKALLLVDELCELKIEDKVIMSLRAHYFMRSISGLYACANPECQGASNTPYGHLTTYKASVCPHCGRPLLELVQCKRCNSFILMGCSNPQTHVITPCDDKLDHDDYFAIDDDINEDGFTDAEEIVDVSPDVFYLTPYVKEKYSNSVSDAHTSTLDIVQTNEGTILENKHFDSGSWVELRKDTTHSYCPTCGRLAYGKRMNFKHFRIPINFINQTVSPVLLKECSQGEQAWGKYIAFTDSRQGTAISAKTFNIDVERRMCREKTMKELAKREGDPEENGIDPAQLKALDPALVAKIMALSAGNAVSKELTLEKLSNVIFDDVLFKHIAGRRSEDDVRPYKAALMRTFIGRRALYDLNAETMGLITLVYPSLKNVHAPEELIGLAEFKGKTISDKDWQDFLKISLDYHVRLGNHIQPLIPGEKKYVRETNISTPMTSSDDRRTGVSSWPSVKSDEKNKLSKKQPRLVLLLCAALGIDSVEELQTQQRNVDAILRKAWDLFVKKHILKRVDANDREGYNHPTYYPNNQYVGCYYLDLSDDETNRTGVVIRTEKAWECPMTGTLLDTIFCGYSPLMVGELSPSMFVQYKISSEPLTMPSRPVDTEELKKWRIVDNAIANLIAQGLWSSRHKYVFTDAPEYIAAEHSAQQSKDLLREYTKGFMAKNPSINVLHCSTTMEMGVDIGDIDIVVMDTVPPTAANYLQRVGRAGRKGQQKAIAFSLCNDTPVGQHAFANPMWALQTTNHMIPVRSSQTIIQRHIKSFFFRQFICEQGEGMEGTISIGEFMMGDNSTCDAFVDFLDNMSTNNAEKQKFAHVFGNMPFTINITKEAILGVQKKYKGIVKELEDAFERYKTDQSRKIAISNQLAKFKQESLLNYLSEEQFIPNASMPTGVVTFDFTDKDQAMRLYKLRKDAEKLKTEKETATDDAEKTYIEQQLAEKWKQIKKLQRETQASRDIRTALNEYAPGQTVVVNEKNFVSAGVSLFGAYNDNTQSRAIYFCKQCGKTEYSQNLDENKTCPNCHTPYRGIINTRESHYTQAYEPIGFRADQNIDSSREEKTEKRFYEIRPVLLQTDWWQHKDVNMCQATTSGEKAEILYYNVGVGYGFAFCKRCGRTSVETDFKREPPIAFRNHKRLWWGDECEATSTDIARNVVFTGKHQTCYSVLRFQKDNDDNSFVKDDQLVYSLGVVLKRALVKYLGIDENEIDFGLKDERDCTSLFIFDTARGGCGYSLHFGNPNECDQILNLARQLLSEYTCNCHNDGGACARCLVDRNNYRHAQLLSKGKVMDWLNKQKTKSFEVPDVIKGISPYAKSVYQQLKGIVKDAINNSDISSLMFCVSDSASDYAINDWLSVNSEIGKLVRHAIENGKQVAIRVEYHPELHTTNADKKPFVDLDERMPDYDVSLVKDNGPIKTALMLTYVEGKTEKFITTDEDALSFSNKWGDSCVHLYMDNQGIEFIEESAPRLEYAPSEIIREGLAKARKFKVGHYFSQIIAPSILKASDIDMIKNILHDKHVKVMFSDMYVNSALSSLLLVYLIKEMKDLFGFSIDEVILQLDSPKRKCVNERFTEYSYINHSFSNKDDADDYTYELFDEILDITPEPSRSDAEHHRWLRFETPVGGVVEIRPDHSIGGGWYSDTTYMNLNMLDGSVETYRKEDILYYAIIKNGNDNR